MQLASWRNFFVAIGLVNEEIFPKKFIISHEWQLFKRLYLTFNLKNFNVFLAKAINTISTDQNKNTNILYKENSKVHLHPLKTSFSKM